MTVLEKTDGLTTDQQKAFAAAIKDVDEKGYAVVENVLSDSELQECREALRSLIEEDRRNGVQLSGYAFDTDDKNIRVWDLVIRHPQFRWLVEHPLAIALVKHVIGSNYAVSNLTANITGPGCGRMYMHADQGFVPEPWPPYAFAVNIAWAFDEFTKDNGGTIVVPGSHLRGGGPEPEGGYDDEVAIECPAGSLFVIDGRVWHQTGENITEDQHRAGIFAYYIRDFLKPQRVWPALIAPERKDEFTEELWRRLGMDALGPVSLKTKKV